MVDIHTRRPAESPVISFLFSLIDALSVPMLILLGGKSRIRRAWTIFYLFPVELCIKARALIKEA